MKKNIVKNIAVILILLLSIGFLFAGIKVVNDSPQYALQKYQLIVEERLAENEEPSQEDTNSTTVPDVDFVVQIYTMVYIVVGALIFILGTIIFCVTYGQFLTKKIKEIYS